MSAQVPSRKAAKSGFRPEIQVLRAIAVGVVVVYHLWPGRLPGGFVGVDVFFVISGYLITAHLLRSSMRPGGLRLFSFWGNRARRLLPLASVVLVVSVGLVLAFLPQSEWRANLRNIIAAALYVENWALASSSVNYLEQDQQPVISQHFWSLSAEEQFYIVWPLLLLFAIFLARKMHRGVGRRSTFDSAGARLETRIRLFGLVAIGLVFALSLLASLWLTHAEPGLAYFATTTRAWEFAAGGLLAFVPHAGFETAPPRRALVARTAASWASVVLILGSAFLISETTPFPGTAALVPVVGTCLFLWAGNVPGPLSPAATSRIRPLTYLGDISYGIYLWHWPLIIVAPFVLGRPPDTFGKLAVIALTIALAAVSKITIEDPFRFGAVWRVTVRRSFYPAAVGMLAVTALTGSVIVGMDQASAAAARQQAAMPAPSVAATTAPDTPLTPLVADRKQDFGVMYDCFDMAGKEPLSCEYGSPDSEFSVAIVGDSHAAHLIPAAKSLAEQRGWRLTTYVGMSCDDGLRDSCPGSPEWLGSIAEGDYDLVLYSAFRNSATPADDRVAFVAALRDAGVPLVLVADVPYNPADSQECVDNSGGSAAAAASCTTSRADALDVYPDAIPTLSTDLGVPFVDLTSNFCDDSGCKAVLGNVVVYQDTPGSHLTNTVSTMLAGPLGESLDEMRVTPTSR
ncbi:acyltransferase family protein [Microbacterium sp. PRC9]|uniref:acyltransferase family protein n=1 Tax=Microbacterium sp. PRC9 TaxID=2962591 RepID=UPI002882B46E|nr:acyltransferase family protein [Microbacterium sp. PRC9]MDT0141085.1 acyltransferase family protein [Microbacterium sp. PRC9]